MRGLLSLVLSAVFLCIGVCSCTTDPQVNEETVPNEYEIEFLIGNDEPKTMVMNVVSSKGDMDLDIEVTGEATITYNSVFYEGTPVEEIRGPYTTSVRVNFRTEGYLKSNYLHAMEGSSVVLWEWETQGLLSSSIIVDISVDLKIHFYRTRDQLAKDLVSLNGDSDRALSLQNPVECIATYSFKSLISDLPSIVTVNGERIKTKN